MKEILVLMLVLMMGWLTSSAFGELHKVGGSKSWSQNVNYTQWSLHEHFYVGDWLYFIFDKRYYNVLEVNETSYESCNDKDFIKNITRGGRDVYQLTEARPYYFLSSGGYCYQGMKVAVYVKEAPIAPAPAPTKSGSGSNFNCLNLQSLLLSMAFVWAMVFTAYN